MYSPSTPHPQHPHHLECPRCASRAVVIHGDSRYVCLNCRWEEDLSQRVWDVSSVFWAALLSFAFALVMLIVMAGESRQGEPQSLGFGERFEGEGAIAHNSLPPSPTQHHSMSQRLIG